MTNIKEPVANKIFAMTVMYKIGAPYPELLSELKTIIETQMPYEKPGFKSRGRKNPGSYRKKLKYCLLNYLIRHLKDFLR